MPPRRRRNAGRWKTSSHRDRLERAEEAAPGILSEKMDCNALQMSRHLKRNP
jgi:hypothetical protein